MKSLRTPSRLGACAAIALAVGGASLPSAIVGPGEWEVSKSAAASGEKVCLTDSALLTQWEHRTKRCDRVVLTSAADRAEVRYTCAGGGFGTSRVQELTPRSIRVDSQGISDGYPFARTIYAHRIGPCESH